MFQTVIEPESVPDPTDVICPKYGTKLDPDDVMGNTHGPYCSADCAVGDAMSLTVQTSLFPGRLPCWVQEQCKPSFHPDNSVFPVLMNWRPACTPTSFG